MKLIQKIALLAALTFGFVGCHGQSDDGEVKVSLVPSATTIVADGEQSVRFEVLYGASNVTHEAQIYIISHPELTQNGDTFTTTEAGEYVFQAIYKDQASEEVRITATEPVGGHESRFERHICVMDLTGAWCTFCPDGMTKLKYFVDKKEWRDIVHMLALHDNTQGEDPMGLALTSQILNDFRLAGFPSFVTDLRDAGSLSDNVGDIVPSFNRSLDDFPAQCDVKIESTLNGRELKMDVSLFAELAGKYSVSVYLVEDDIIAPQKDGSITHAEFNHQHVVRALVNSNYKGESLGSLAAEQEGVKSYTYTLPEEWKVEDMTIVALAITENGYVNNVAACELGESVDYKYLAQ